MAIATISRGFRVVIPSKIGKSMRLLPGAKVNILQYGHSIQIWPVQPVRELRGFLKGIKTDVPRVADRF